MVRERKFRRSDKFRCTKTNRYAFFVFSGIVRPFLSLSKTQNPAVRSQMLVKVNLTRHDSRGNEVGNTDVICYFDETLQLRARFCVLKSIYVL